MPCLNHTIQYGDSLYKLSMMYNTTIDRLLEDNPYLNPYNLQVGSSILVCFNDYKNPATMPNAVTYNTQNTTMPSNTMLNDSQIDLITKMNTVWDQHIQWVRSFLVSVAENLQDLNATKTRVLQTPVDIANMFKPYYGDAAANQLKDLLTKHVTIGGDIITGTKNGTDVSELNKRWYENGDKISDFLSSINPYYDNNLLKNMFRNHLDLETKLVSARFNKDYNQDIIASGNVEKEILNMARYLSDGIIKQFPNNSKV